MSIASVNGRDSVLLHPVRMPVILALVAVVLLATYWVTRNSPGANSAEPGFWVRMFDVNEEGNVPTWFSSTLWFLSACYAWLASRLAGTPARGRWTWLALGAIFVLLSLDEAASIHEHLNITGDIEWRGLLTWSWVIPGFLFMAVVALVFVRFVFSLPAPVPLLFILAGILFAVGALGVEMYGAAVYDGAMVFPSWLTWGRIIALEEGLEMAGVIVNVAALLVYLRKAEGRGIAGSPPREAPASASSA